MDHGGGFKHPVGAWIGIGGAAALGTAAYLTRNSWLPAVKRKFFNSEVAELKHDLVLDTAKVIEKEVINDKPKDIIENDIYKDKGIAKADIRHKADQLLIDHANEAAQLVKQNEAYLLDNREKLFQGNPREFLKQQIVDNPAEFSLDEKGFEQYAKCQAWDEQKFFDERLDAKLEERFESYYNYLRYDNLPELFKSSFRTNGELDSLNDKLKTQARKLLKQTIDVDAYKYKTEFDAIKAKYRILSLEDKLEKQIADYEIKKYPEILVKDGSAVEEAVKRIEKTRNKIQILDNFINDATKKDKLYNILKNSDLYQALVQQKGLLHEAFGAIVHQGYRVKIGEVIDNSLADMLDKSDLEKYNVEIAYFRFNAYQSLKEKYGDEFASLAMETFKFKIEQSETEVGKFIVTDLTDSENMIKQEIGSRIKNLKEDLDVLPEFKKEKHDLETIIEASIEDEEGLVIDDIEADEQWFDNQFSSI